MLEKASTTLRKEITPLTLVMVSGVLLGIAQTSSFFWWLSLIGLVPLFAFIRRNKGYQEWATTWKFFSGWLFLFIYLGISIVWFFDTLPLSWAVDNSIVAFLSVLTAWGIVTTSLSFVGGYSFLYIEKVFQYKKASFLLIPVGWVLFEYARMWLFSIVTYAPGMSLGAHFSFGMIGYPLADHTLLLQLATFGGIYTLSFIAVLINVVIYVAYSRYGFSKKGMFVYGVGIFVLLATYFGGSYVTTEHKGSPVNVAIMSTHFSKEEQESALFAEKRDGVYRGLIEENREQLKGVDYLLFPEGANFAKRELTRESNIFKSILRKDAVVVDSGKVLRTGNTSSEVAYIASPNSRTTTNYYEKQVLVPLGEYIPYIFKPFARLLSLEEGLTIFTGETSPDSVHAGGQYTAQGGNIDIILCSDIMSPSLERNKSSLFVASLASHAHFNSSEVLYKQNVRMAKVLAVREGKPFIQASNSVPSFVVDKNGILTDESKHKEDSLLITTIHTEE